MNFDLQPTHLKSELLQLIPLQENHFDQLYSVASDEMLWEQHPNKNRYQHKVFKTFFEGAIQSNGAFVIIEKQTGETIGSSRYYDFNEVNDSILIGYTFIARKFWGKGYNKDLKKLMMEYAFQYVSKIIFHIGATNWRSQKAIEKIGAIKIDEFQVEYFGEESKLNYIYQIVNPNKI